MFICRYDYVTVFICCLLKFVYIHLSYVVIIGRMSSQFKRGIPYEEDVIIFYFNNKLYIYAHKGEYGTRGFRKLLQKRYDDIILQSKYTQTSQCIHIL